MHTTPVLVKDAPKVYESDGEVFKGCEIDHAKPVVFGAAAYNPGVLSLETLGWDFFQGLKDKRNYSR